MATRPDAEGREFRTSLWRAWFFALNPDAGLWARVTEAASLESDSPWGSREPIGFCVQSVAALAARGEAMGDGVERGDHANQRRRGGA